MEEEQKQEMHQTKREEVSGNMEVADTLAVSDLVDKD